jgi:hypothetical protein
MTSFTRESFLSILPILPSIINLLFVVLVYKAMTAYAREATCRTLMKGLALFTTPWAIKL